MYTCETCGEEFDTLSSLRLDHEPCPVDEERRRHEEAIQRLADERGLEIGDLCRVIETGLEAEIVDVEPATDEDGEPTVVWIPAEKDDEPEHRRTSSIREVV